MKLTKTDFAKIYCLSNSTIEKKIASLVTVFRSFDQKKRKRFFTLEESKQIIQLLGIPPENSYNHFLQANYPTLFLFGK